ncbi:glycosyltransferase family 4 protein [Cryobacterium sp. GrIS_2_6]|uniref:glycosyltransferase family 4 protein n=1 Tax=Cryobacterium sp. GrIS_2_6 TaxID=3162785 RepID=UPI002E085047|nr:glycosyltransferase involved in cell wall biosynthesis [Cryobacterium psychrotolerans]
MNTPLKVLIVTQSLEIWGAERTLIELSKRVDHERIQLTFLVAHSSPLAAVVRDLGFAVVNHRFARHPALERNGGLQGAGVRLLLLEALSAWGGGWRLAPVLRRFDLVLSFSIWQAIETSVASKLSRRPLVLDLHETFSGRRGHSVVRALARLSRGVIAPSLSVLQRSGLEPSSTISVIPRPVTVPLDHPKIPHLRPSDILVGVFGQISPHKGVDSVIESVAACRSDSVRVLIVGGRPEEIRTDYENNVRSSAARLGARASVADTVPHVGELMSTCDFVVNASDHEAFGRGIVEAIAARAVPISVGDSGPKEIIQDTGIGVALDSISQLTGYLDSLADGTVPRPKVDDESRAAALAQYDPIRIADAYFRTLEQLAGGTMDGARPLDSSQTRL